MAATLGELRTAVAAVLEDRYAGWNVYKLPPETIEPPAIMLGGFALDTGTFGDVSIRVNADLQMMVSRRNVYQLEALDELLSPSHDQSLWSVFNEDPTLGDVVGYCSMQSAGNYGEILIGDQPYYTASATLSVML